MEAARQHAAVVSAALGTLGGFVEWAPLGRLCGGSVVEACSFFLSVPDFRDAALVVVKQVGVSQLHVVPSRQLCRGTGILGSRRHLCLLQVGVLVCKRQPFAARASAGGRPCWWQQ